MKGSWQKIPIEGAGEMGVYVCRAKGVKTAPVVFVLQEAFGVNSHMRDVTERVAELGYHAYSPELFHRTAPHGFAASYDDFPSLKPHLDAVNVQTLSTDLRALHSFATRDAGESRVIAMGFCMGGRCAFLANTLLPLKGAISLYGSRIPALKEHMGQLHAPMCLMWGGADAGIDLAQRDEVRTLLRAAKKPFVDVEFSPAEHGFFCNERKSYHAASAHQAWALMTQFMQDCLSP